MKILMVGGSGFMLCQAASLSRFIIHLNHINTGSHRKNIYPPPPLAGFNGQIIGQK